MLVLLKNLRPLILMLLFVSCQVQEQEATLISGKNSQARIRNSLAITSTNGSVNNLNKSTYSLAGTCSEQSSSIKMTIGPLTKTTTCNQESFAFVVDLSGAGDGSFTFQFTETLSSGKQYAASYTTSKDTTPPVVNDIVDDNVPVASKTIFWSCTETCSFRYTVSTSAFVSPIGSYQNVTSATVSTGVNRYYIHVQAMDAAGNESAVETAYFFIDDTL